VTDIYPPEYLRRLALQLLREVGDTVHVIEPDANPAITVADVLAAHGLRQAGRLN
jgi:hypothetical protein